MFYSSFLKSFWKTDSRRSNSSLFLFLFMNPVFRLHGDGAARWRTLPVLWMRDGVDDGIVDGRGLGNDGGDRVHVRSQHVCIPAAKKSGSVLKHIRTSPLTKSCFTFNQDHHHQVQRTSTKVTVAAVNLPIFPVKITSRRRSTNRRWVCSLS